MIQCLSQMPTGCGFMAPRHVNQEWCLIPCFTSVAVMKHADQKLLWRKGSPSFQHFRENTSHSQPRAESILHAAARCLHSLFVVPPTSGVSLPPSISNQDNPQRHAVGQSDLDNSYSLRLFQVILDCVKLAIKTEQHSPSFVDTQTL